MANEAMFCVRGYVATQPKRGRLKDGTPTLFMRVGWTPRVISKQTGEWTDQQTSYVSVTCFRKVAEHAAICLRRGDPITVKGTLRVREYADQAGVKRNSVEVTADSLGHDMSHGISIFSKLPHRAEQTAWEHEQSQAGERDPLPGDVAALAGSEAAALGELPAPDDDADDLDDELDVSDLAELDSLRPETEPAEELV